MAYECIIARGKECDGCCECVPESLDDIEEANENTSENSLDIHGKES